MTRLMQELVNKMNYLDKTNDLTFPLEEKWENLPTGWMGFIQEVYIYAFPIKIVVNGEDYLFKVCVLEDFRDILKEG